MRACLIAWVVGCSAVFAAVPQFSLDVDSQKPAATWTLKLYQGSTPWVRVNLLQAGEAWTPTNAMSGILWYGAAANWAATSTVRIAATFATNTSYIDVFPSAFASNTLSATGTFYGGILMTNASLTEVFEWGRGYVQVLPSGGIISTATLDLRGDSVLPGYVVTNRGATINGSPITNGAAITVSSALPAGTITATNQGLAGQSFFYSSGTPSGVYTGYFATAAGSGNMLASMYDPDNQQRGVVFTNDVRVLNAVTNETDPVFATNGVKRSDTNGWTVSSHSGLVATNDTRYLAALTNAAAFDSTGTASSLIAVHNTNELSHLNLASVVYVTNQLASYVSKAMTNGWTVSSHATLLTSGGATINGEPITNGAAFSITGGGGGGGISNIAVAGVTGTLTGSGSNIVAAVSLASLAGAGVVTNGQVGVRFGMVTSDTLQAASSSGWSIKANNGATCISGGAGGGCNVTLADGTTVNGLLTANGGITSTGAVNVLGGGNVVTNGQKIAASTNSDWAAWAANATNAVTVTGAQSNLIATALQPASTQNLATVSQLATATNAAIIDATNRVAGVGYLLPASTQNLATVAYVDAATNTINAAFLAGKGAVTNYQCVPQTVFTVTNTSPTTITALVNRVYSLTAIGSSNITVALEGTNCAGESWLNLNITQTNGGTTWFWPSGLYHWNRGAGRSNAPGLSNYGRVELIHNAQQFQAFHVWTNAPMGAP